MSREEPHSAPCYLAKLRGSGLPHRWTLYLAGARLSARMRSYVFGIETVAVRRGKFGEDEEAAAAFLCRHFVTETDPLSCGQGWVARAAAGSGCGCVKTPGYRRSAECGNDGTVSPDSIDVSRTFLEMAPGFISGNARPASTVPF